MKLLFVCLGNICRSPAAETVARTLIDRRGLAARISCDSAGTGDWHVGEPPDRRAQQAGRLRGYDLSGLRARQLTSADFRHFDYVIVMDNQNLANARVLQSANDPARLVRLLDYLPGQPLREVPDPYYGDAHGFDAMFELLEQAVAALLDELVPA